MKITLLTTIIVLLLSGCSTIEPQLSVDVNVSQSYQNSTISSRVLADKWWSDFDSEELNIFVEKALVNNPDILMAYEKIEQAKILLASAGAEYLPSVDVRANTSANRMDNDATSGINTQSSGATITMSYEIDVWDKIGSKVRASRATTDMSVYDYEAIRLSLIASVAESYIRVVASKEKLSSAQEQLLIMKNILKVLEAKRAFGAIDDADVSGQKAAVLSQQNSILGFKNRYENEKLALSLLISEPSDTLALIEKSLFDLRTPEVDSGLPSELLLRRPDIAAKKAALQANKALIQVADASRYPSFSLSASGGLASGALMSLSNPTTTIGAGLGLNYNLFDAGRLKNQVLLEESKAKAAQQSYRKTVLQACKEVEEALGNLYYAKKQDTITKELLEEYLFRMNLIDTKYQFGAVDFQVFLDAQQSYILTKQQTLNALEIKLNAIVILHKALGGGFEQKKDSK